MTTPTRTVLRISGPDRLDFLQGLVSNDVLFWPEGELRYAALLTPQGKYLADFFLEQRGDAVLLDVATSIAPALKQRLTMYKLRAKVGIEDTDLIVSTGTGPAPTGALPDPRHPAMGWRQIAETDQSQPTDWDALRVAHCIPETGIELTPDTFLLEAGFERLNGVNFKKGCYVGQEVTARMKHKTELRKGLATVQITGTAPVGTPLLTAEGKEAGTLFTTAGDQAIAYLRFDRAGGTITAEGAEVMWGGV